MTVNRRRDFLKDLVWAGLGSAVFLRPAMASAEIRVRRPNVIFILADDLGYGDLSCFGQKKFSTPNIDRLAAEGMKFTRHYCGCTVCAPSRSTVMTGLHTGHTPIRGNKQVGDGQAPLPQGTETLARCLKRAGYATGCFGKWGLGFPGSVGDPVNVGFDTFFGYNCQAEAHSYYPERLWRDRQEVKLDGQTYSPPLIMGEALKFVREHAGKKPFFAWLTVTIPHAAMSVPPELHAPFRKQFPEFEGTRARYDKTREDESPASAFPAMIGVLDRQVGEVLALVKALGIEEDTLVLFASDNGPHKEGGHQPDFWASSGGLRGYKRDLYEGGIRTPLLARWPGMIRPGSESAHLSAFWDLMPTLCELAGEKPACNMDGLSFAPTLLGREGQPQHSGLYWEFHEQGGKRAYLKGNLKAIQLNVDKLPEGPVEVYDLAADPAEVHNIADRHGLFVDEARCAFVAQHSRSETFPWKWEKTK